MVCFGCSHVFLICSNSFWMSLGFCSYTEAVGSPEAGLGLQLRWRLDLRSLEPRLKFGGAWVASLDLGLRVAGAYV